MKRYTWVIIWVSAYLGAILLFALWYLCLDPSNWGSRIEIKSFSDAFYFSVVTITSLGFGDIFPATGSWGRILVAVEAIIGILIIGFFLNDVAQRQAARLDEQSKKAEEEKKASSALESLNTFKQILLPVFDKYLRGIFMMVTPMKEKFKMPKDIFHHDFDFQYKDLSHIYEQTILMSADYHVPAIDAHFTNQDLVFEELRYFVTNADLSYWPELRNLVYQFIALHHQFQVRDIILNNSSRTMGDGKQLSEYISEQLANTEKVPKFTSGNMFSPYVALYYTTKANAEIIKGIFYMIEQTLNEGQEKETGD